MLTSFSTFKDRRFLQENKVIVGRYKPILNYVTACITIFNRGEEQVTLRARGDAINVAVDAVQLLRNRFLSDVNIQKITIDGEAVKTKDGRILNLPVIEITISRSK